MGLVGTVFADHCSQLNSPQGKPLCRWSLAHRLMAFSFSRMPVSIWLLAVTLTAGPCTLLAVENFSRVGFAAEFFFFFFFAAQGLRFFRVLRMHWGITVAIIWLLPLSTISCDYSPTLCSDLCLQAQTEDPHWTSWLIQWELNREWGRRRSCGKTCWS